VCEILVDPEVSKRKFEREIENYRRLEDDYIRRGLWMVKASWPEVFMVLGAPHLKPPAVVFGAVIDFTNYDFWAPSVRLVDPFTREPYKTRNLPSNLVRMTEAIPPEIGLDPQAAMLWAAQHSQALMQGQPDEIPFLCIPGVREYHQHPAHTGNSWLLHRGTGEGTLFFIVDQLWKYGVQGVASYNCQLTISINGFAPKLGIQ
jgi:Predicted metal binding domain